MTNGTSRGKSFEYRILYKLKDTYSNAIRIPSSGSAQNFKGDIWAGDYLIECKKTMHESYRLEKETLAKLEMQAKQHNRKPALIFSLANTKPYVVLPMKDWLELIK